MAQDIFEQLHAAVKQAESQGKRFDEKGNLLTSPKGAQGEMQVMPKTARDPGFGVAPAQNKSPDELARVGKDYLKAMVDKYGDTQKALIAYNWGPKNTDDWLAKGADPKILPAETKSYVGKISKALGGDKVAPLAGSEPTESEKTMTKALGSGMSAQNMVKDAGPGYKAAMAMMFLADDKPETSEDDIWKEAETPVEEPDATPNALASLDLGYQSPFPAAQPVQPQRFAEGGMPFAPTIGVKGTAREELEKIKADYDAYNAKVDAYNKQGTDYGNSFYKDNGQMILAQKNGNPRSNRVNPYIYYTANDKGELSAAYKPTQDLSKAVYTAAPDAAGYFMVRTADIAAPGAAPTAPSVTPEQMQAKADFAKADAKTRQTAVNVAFDPAAYGLSMNKLFSHGGAVHRADGSPEYGEIPTGGITDDTRTAMATPITARGALNALKEVGMDVGRGAVSNAESLVRGAVSQVPGVFGDLESLGRKGINFSFGPGGVKVDEKTYAPTSEEIRAATPRMTAARPESSGMESLGEVMAPGMAKAAAPVAKSVGKEAARQVLRGMEGEGPLSAISPPIMYAVKPRGGTFASSGSIANEPLSDFDRLLDNYLDRSLKETPDTSHDAVRDFIDKKARKYFTTEYGTGGDSIRTAMRTGDMPLAGADVQRFPPYLLHAATNPEVPGHEMAKLDLERIYDKGTNMDAKVLGLHNSSDGDARSRFQAFMDAQKEKDRQLMSAEGVPNEYQNPEIRGYSLSELEAYPSSTRSLKRLMEAGVEGKLPEGVKGAMQREQPIYDINEPYMAMFSPKNVAENIAVIPANKLKNMSFADAMIEGSKQMNVYRNYDAAVAKAERGGTIPKPVLEMFTKPFLKGGTGEWLQITDPRATALEGKLMNHSVGGYKDGDRYGVEYTGLPYGGKKAFDEGLVKVYSLRDDKGMPTVTLEMAKSDAGKGDKWNITQIRSRFNSEPAADQWDDIFKFIEKGEKHVGQIKQNSYNKNAAGEAVPGSAVNWGSAYRDWKDGIDPRLGVQRSDNPPGWGQAEMAQGGAVERVLGDNRRYL
jgi:hypothetical protein